MAACRPVTPSQRSNLPKHLATGTGQNSRLFIGLFSLSAWQRGQVKIHRSFAGPDPFPGFVWLSLSPCHSKRPWKQFAQTLGTGGTGQNSRSNLPKHLATGTGQNSLLFNRLPTLFRFFLFEQWQRDRSKFTNSTLGNGDNTWQWGS